MFAVGKVKCMSHKIQALVLSLGAVTVKINAQKILRAYIIHFTWAETGKLVSVAFGVQQQTSS